MSSDGGGESTIRYAPYLEDFHSGMLDYGGLMIPVISFIHAFNQSVGASPYGDAEYINTSKGFFGAWADDPNTYYAIENFPSLWDMFGKFMAGLDVHDLWADTLEDVVNGPEIANAVVNQWVTIQDEMDQTIVPKFMAGMRDINSVQSSTFVMGKALMQSQAIKAVNKFMGDLKLHALDLSVTMWAKHLDWNQGVIHTYEDMFKLYYGITTEIDKNSLEWKAKDAMWDFNLFDGVRSITGALNGAAAMQSKNEPNNSAGGILGNALGGAAAGAQVGGGWGALIGGVLGGAAGFL